MRTRAGWRRVLPERRAGWVLLALLLVFLFGTRLVDRGEERRWARVEPRDLVVEVELAGELEAVHSTQYGPPAIPDVWEYKISFLAPEGSRVAAGDPILGFETSALEERLANRMADRDAAQKQLEKRTKDLEVERRNNELALAEARANIRRADLKVNVPEEVIARQDLRTAQVDRRLAEEEARYRQTYLLYLDRIADAELEAMQREYDRQANRVAEIESKIEQMMVRALRPGTVMHRTNWQGNKKKVGDRVWRAQVVVEIPDLDEMMATAEVDEAQAGRLAVGQTVRYTLDAHPDRTYTARVGSIARTVQPRSWRDRRRVVRLELELEATDRERMRPGMRLHGSIEVERFADVLTVPLEAVVAQGDGAAVCRRTGLGEEWVRPQLGRRNDEWVEVRGGLRAGDRVGLGCG